MSRPVLASLAATVAPSVAVTPDPGQVQLKRCDGVPLAPAPSMVRGGAGDAPAQGTVEPLAGGVTAETRAGAPPELASSSSMVTVGPGVTLERVATRTAAVWTVTGIPLTLGATGAPLFASTAVTFAPSVRLPASGGLQVQVNVALSPPRMARGSPPTLSQSAAGGVGAMA